MRKLTPEWLTRAEHDLGTARREQRPNPDAAAYHAQQSAEKYIKGYLHEQGVPPPRVHDLAALSELHPTLHLALADHVASLHLLTDYEAESRYPPGARVTEEQAQQAVAMAEQVRAIVLRLLGAEP